jgi:ribose transport system permease protein
MTRAATAEQGQKIRARTLALLRGAMAIPAWPALILLLAIAAVVQPRLMSLPFLLIVLRQAVPLALAALGQCLPMIGRSIDLSIGGVIAVVNVTLALPVFSGGPAWMSVAFPLAFGAAIGLFNAGAGGVRARLGRGGDARCLGHADRRELPRLAAGRPAAR